MELRLIATFLRVAELQSFSRAAEQIGYSQATVTVQIQQLEQALGTQLFERIGKRIKLTAHGEQFIPYAMEVMRVAQRAEHFLSAADHPSGTLRIGTAESLLLSVLTPILMTYHRRYPEVEISVQTGRINALFDMVRHNDVDVLFFLDKKTDFPDWVKVMERPEAIRFVAPASHPLCAQRRIPLARVVQEPFALTEKGVSYRYDLEQLLAAQGLDLHPFLETGNTDIITRVLLQNDCLSFLPQYVVQAHLAAGTLRTLDVDGCDLHMWSQLVHHKNKWRTPQLEAFIALMGEEWAAP